MLDLRGNGGGLLNEAVLTVEHLRRGRRDRHDRGRGPRPQQTYEAAATRSTRAPMVVLINRDTASAAEILAAALADYDLATSSATRTFGKGTFQEVIELDATAARST